MYLMFDQFNNLFFIGKNCEIVTSSFTISLFMFTGSNNINFWYL